MSPEDFRAILETNLFGVFYCCHEAIPLMKQRGGGNIITSLTCRSKSSPGVWLLTTLRSSASKVLVEALMQEVRHDGIKVSYIMPGSVNTAFGGDEAGDSKSWHCNRKISRALCLTCSIQDDRALTSRFEI